MQIIVGANYYKIGLVFASILKKNNTVNRRNLH